jgi:hypothetical protein
MKHLFNCTVLKVQVHQKILTWQLSVHDVEVESVLVLQHLAAHVAQYAELALLHLDRHLKKIKYETKPNSSQM